ncbi:MAG TPA: hypothetical protein VEB22_00595 [Phycisphaerales bacterium]|nr:hypothetical protein [Phycisphaerales bacterium]
MSAELLAWIERAGGFGLAVLMLYGLYRLARFAAEKLGVPLVEGIVGQFREVVIELKAAVTELREMRLEAAERHAEIRECIEKSAKETRHDLRAPIQSIATRLDRDDPTPAFGVRAQKESKR